MIIGAIVLGVCVSVGGLATAATLEWDRNSESDMKDYQIWACFTPSCVVIKSSGTLQPGTIAQTTVGVKPTATLDISGKEGSVAVTARDLSLNESGLSIAVPFDAKAPAAPTGPAFR
jgi:hypothetical protein